MAEIDRDKDGAVSLEEFQERMRRFGGGPRRGGGPPGTDGPKGAPGDKRETGEKQSG